MKNKKQEWVESLMNKLNEGGIWIYPNSGSIWKKEGRTLTRIKSGNPDMDICVGIEIAKYNYDVVFEPN
jgi:hypothetical protein